MSKVIWAYPKGTDATDNGHDYPPLGTFSEDIAKTNIEKYMQAAGVSAGDSALKVKFTIAGSSLQDHPTYKVFRDAAALLNSLGWDVEVVCDTQALTKINTGSLEVWAAAWSSALDPDMYQVYHKDSTATSTLAWGYNYLKTSGTAEETQILDELSDLIDRARETNDQSVRANLYKQAMSQILELGTTGATEVEKRPESVRKQLITVLPRRCRSDSETPSHPTKSGALPKCEPMQKERKKKKWQITDAEELTMRWHRSLQ